jgi:hypothetical protein
MMTKIKFVLWLALFLVLTYYLGNFLIWLKLEFTFMTMSAVVVFKFFVRSAMIFIAIMGAIIFTSGGNR